ncbi:MAG: non-heme iron oxygenase ferredoxin subunit [Chloroflexi bacterium]|nr:non-heme iron oxygenase ferredoxin subunit [Chloroflexota bacterium]MBP8056413.1 non-heme iron oxygenase ferredoxin subunit [Chloroflexota bacterium]
MSKFVKVAHIADIPPGERLGYDFEYETVVILNAEGTFYCIADRCTHDDGPLGDGTFDFRRCEIHCPRHGAIFDIRTGEALALPAVRPIPTFAVKIEGDEIWVESPDEG